MRAHAEALVALARRSGLTLEARPPDKLRVEGPRQALEALREALAEAKPEVLRLLAEERCGSPVEAEDACPWPAGFPCPACGTREEHGHA